MANAVYPIYKQALMKACTLVSLNGTTTNAPHVVLVDTGTYSYATGHDFFSDLSGVIGTANGMEITSPTVVGRKFDGCNVTFTAVTTATSIEALVIYRRNNGANTTWRLVLYENSSVTGLPVTPNGGDISISWNASGIFDL
jgi:hypothetical protein